MAVRSGPQGSATRHGYVAAATSVGCAFLLFFTPSEAFAYVDPGSGALIWQAALSAFFGALFLARRTLLKLLGGLRHRDRPSRELVDALSSDEGLTDRPESRG